VPLVTMLTAEQWHSSDSPAVTPMTRRSSTVRRSSCLRGPNSRVSLPVEKPSTMNEEGRRMVEGGRKEGKEEGNTREIRHTIVGLHYVSPFNFGDLEKSDFLL
jgi:hypothetical protein